MSEPLIVIAGMGPVGMTAALAFARRGIPVTVLEGGSDLSTESRASTFHPPSLEILDELGVVAELIESGLKAPGFQYRGRDRALIAHLDMALLAGDTRFPFRIQNEQGNLTRIIRRHLERMPHVTLRYDAPVERVELGSSTADVYLPGDGRTPSYRADWLIAADGASSTVRRSLGIAFEGVTYPERFLVASTTHDFLDDYDDLAYVSYVYDPDDWGVLLRTPKHWRVLFPIPEDETDAEAQHPDRVEERLQGVVPLDEPYPVSHTTIYAVHQRLAARFGLGRVLLAGDAAHINNPLGGMGMNSGIHDAHAAVTAIVSALEGGDPERAVEVYSAVRRDAASGDVQRVTQQNYEEMRERDQQQRSGRQAQVALIASDPVKARAYLRGTSMLASFEVSKRRMRRGLSPVRAAAPAPAGRQLSDRLVETTLIEPEALIRALPEGLDEPLEIARFVAEAERDDVAALVVAGVPGRVAAAHAARRELLVIAAVDVSSPAAEASAIAAGQAAVAAGADLLGLLGDPDADSVVRIHRTVSEVPLALLGSASPSFASPTELTLAGVALVIPVPVSTPVPAPEPALADLP